MRKFLLIVALAAVYSLSFAQGDNKSKLSLTTKMFLNELKDGGFDPAVSSARRSRARQSGEIPLPEPRGKNDGRYYAAPDTIDGRAYISAFIRLDDSNNTNALESLGVQVECRFENGLVTANIPVEKLSEVAAIVNVKQIDVAKVLRKDTHESRRFTKVSDILSLSEEAVSRGLQTKYDGKGVLLGVVDEGIDFNHIAFRDKDGKSRVCRAYVYADGKDKDYDMVSTIPTTDNDKEDHGTHTASTAGGSSVIINGQNVTVTDNHSEATCGGMAPAVDLYLCGVRDLISTKCANALSKICKYADEKGLPVVISNSYGAQSGSRDGNIYEGNTGNGEIGLYDVCSTLFNDEHPNHIIVFSTGNEAGRSMDNEGGGKHILASGSKDSPLGTILRNAAYPSSSCGGFSCDGGYVYEDWIAEIWTRSYCGNLKFNLYVLDSSSGKIKTTIPVNLKSGEATDVSADLSKYYSGKLEVYSEVYDKKQRIVLKAGNEKNGNSLTSEDFSFFSALFNSRYKSDYTLAFDVYPEEGSCEFDVWGDGACYLTNYLSTKDHTWTEGSDDMSANTEVTYPNVISVGAYAARAGCKDYKGNLHTFDKYKSGEIASFSSYATVAQNPAKTTIPWITAPGTLVYAAVNHYHTTGGFMDDSYECPGMYRINSNVLYPYGTMDGTSMATPVVAGIVALWLQAAKEKGKQLTTSEVKKIMKETAFSDGYTEGIYSARFGNGKINALGGILSIVNSPTIDVSSTELTFTGEIGETVEQIFHVKMLNATSHMTVQAFLGDKNGVFNIDKPIMVIDSEGVDVHVTWTPTEVGTTPATITLKSEEAGEVVVSLTGIVQAQPAISVNTNKLTFTSSPNTSSSRSLTVKGYRLREDAVLVLDDKSGVFSINKTDIPAKYLDEPTTITVNFTPRSAGNYTGTLTIVSGDAERTVIGLYGSAGITGTLVRYEYWFDDETPGKNHIDLSGVENDIDYNINTSGLSGGMHLLHTRVVQRGGEYPYSPVSTTLFFKRPEGIAKQVEYWFGDKYKDPTVVALSAADGESEEVVIDMSNAKTFPTGQHRLNIRVATSGQTFGNVYTTSVMKKGNGKFDILEYWVGKNGTKQTLKSKTSSDGVSFFDGDLKLGSLPIGLHQLNYRAVSSDGTAASMVYSTTIMKSGTGNIDKFEYWFGDKYENPQTISSVARDKDGNYIFDSNLDFGDLPMGAHRLNYRALSSDGNAISAIYTTTVFVRKGKTQKLEYWFDDDRGKLQPLEATATANTFTFDKDLDLSHLSPGAHRLYYRPVSSDGTLAGAISSTSLIANSLYRSKDNPVKVTSYSLSIDEGTPMYYRVLNPAGIITQPFTLDARKMADGEHQLSMKFWNSMGGGTSMKTSFTKKEIVPPSVTLTATEKNGQVSLNFNSVPNDVGYRICRVDGNNVKAIITGQYVNSYPASISFEDSPAEGSYTYYAESIYIDPDGKQQRIRSNEVTVNVSKPQKEETIAEQFGYVSGRIVCDQNTPTYGLKVAFSDGVTLSAANASFLRLKIPVGKVLTLSVTGDDTHEYEPLTLTVKAGANYVTLNGTQVEGQQPDNLANDLCFGSDIEWITVDGLNCARFKVQNLSPNKTWQGQVRMKAIDKAKADKKHYDLATLPYSNKNLYNHYSGDLEIGASADKTVTIIIDDLTKKEDTEYYMFFETIGKWKGIDMDKETKPIAINGSLGVTENPVDKLIEKKVQIEDIWDEEAMQKLANLIVRLSSLNDGFADKTGDLSCFRSEMVKMAQYLTGQTDESKAINGLMDLLDSKSLLEIMTEPGLSSGFSHLFDVGSDLIGKMPEKYWNGLMRQIVKAADAKFLLSEFVQVVKGMTGKDELERAFACSNLLYANIAYAASSSGAANPYSSLMYSYMVVGKALSNKVMELGKIVHDVWLSERLYLNNPFTGEQTGENKNKYNTTCDFKIIVKSGKKKIDFTDVDMSRQVKRVCIKASNNSTDGVAVIPFTCKFMKDCIMLVSLGSESIENVSGISTHLGAELTEFYMEIEWDNGRVTKIPLIEETEGIEIHTGKRLEGQTGYEEDLDQSVYTITLTTASGKDHIGDELYLGTNKKRK